MSDEALLSSILPVAVLAVAVLAGVVRRRLRTVVPSAAPLPAHASADGAPAAEHSPLAAQTLGEAQERVPAESGVAFVRPASRVPPVLDAEILTSIRQLGSDVLERAFEAYGEDAPRRTMQIHGALAAGDATLLDEAAHALKGSSGILGGARVAALCDQIMRAARANQLSEARTLSEPLADEVGELCSALRQLLSELRGARQAGGAGS